MFLLDCYLKLLFGLLYLGKYTHSQILTNLQLHAYCLFFHFYFYNFFSRCCVVYQLKSSSKQTEKNDPPPHRTQQAEVFCLWQYWLQTIQSTLIHPSGWQSSSMYLCVIWSFSCFNYFFSLSIQKLAYSFFFA